jgi:hypothetical protein
LSPVAKVAVFGVAEYGIQNALLEPLEELELTPLEELLDEDELLDELLEEELVEEPELLDEDELLDEEELLDDEVEEPELLEDEDELVELEPLPLLLDELPPHPARIAASSIMLTNGALVSVPRTNTKWFPWRMSLAPSTEPLLSHPTRPVRHGSVEMVMDVAVPRLGLLVVCELNCLSALFIPDPCAWQEVFASRTVKSRRQPQGAVGVVG